MTEQRHGQGDIEKAPPEQTAEARRRRQEQRDPTGHGMQVPPHQQREIAESEEHRDDAADSDTISDVDQGTVNRLKE